MTHDETAPRMRAVLHSALSASAHLCHLDREGVNCTMRAQGKTAEAAQADARFRAAWAGADVQPPALAAR